MIPITFHAHSFWSRVVRGLRQPTGWVESRL